VGLNAGAWAGLAGGISGGLIGCIDAYQEGYDNIWTAEKKIVSYTYDLNEIPTQAPDEPYCTMLTYENQEKMVGKPYDYNSAKAKTPMHLKNGKPVGCDPRLSAANGGYDVSGFDVTMGDFDTGVRQWMGAKKPFGIAYPNGDGTGHMVSPYKYELWKTQTGKQYSSFTVWDPSLGMRSFSPTNVQFWRINR
jgi:hypothetical protein